MKTQSIVLPDFDTGKPRERCEYPLADIAYSDLVLKHKEENFRNVPVALQQDIMKFYLSGTTTEVSGESPKYCNRFQTALSELKAVKFK